MKRSTAILTTALLLLLCGRLSAQEAPSYAKGGVRADFSFGMSLGWIEELPTDNKYSFVGGGIGLAGYYVTKGRKVAVGGLFDIYHNVGTNNISYSTMMAAPALSYNFTPFRRIHLCLDGGVGYLRRKYHAENYKADYIKTLNGRIQHSLAVKVGVSMFKWMNGGMPGELRAAVIVPFGGSVLMSARKAREIKDIVREPVFVTLTFGVRFGDY